LSHFYLRPLSFSSCPDKVYNFRKPFPT
jgi:hypothetical protein